MSSGKHILFVTKELVPYYYGGIGTLFKAQARLLLKKGYKVSFITRGVENSDSEVLSEHYGEAELHYVDVQQESSFVDYSPTGGVISTYSMAYAIGVERKFAEICLESVPDIVICADFGGEGFFLFLKSRLLKMYHGTRFILHISGGLHEILTTYEGGNESTISELNELKNKLDCSIEDSCIYLASEVIVPTHSAWKTVSERLQVEKFVDVVPNLLDRESFCDDRVTPARECNYVLFVGRLDRVKGADVLLKFFIRNHQMFGADMKLIMVGRNSFWKEYNCTFLEYWKERIPADLCERIIFTGQVDHGQVKKYFSQATFCVFPSRLEMFGNVCLEAMSFGVPCIVAMNTGLAEILGDELGHYVADFESDQSSIVQTISGLISLDFEERRNVGREFRQRFEQITESAENDFLSIIEKQEPGYDNVNASCQGEIYQRMFTAISAMTDITYHLGNDINQLRNHYNPDEDTYREIVRGESSPEKNSLIKSIYDKALHLIHKK